MWDFNPSHPEFETKEIPTLTTYWDGGMDKDVYDGFMRYVGVDNVSAKLAIAAHKEFVGREVTNYASPEDQEDAMRLDLAMADSQAKKRSAESLPEATETEKQRKTEAVALAERERADSFRKLEAIRNRASVERIDSHFVKAIAKGAQSKIALDMPENESRVTKTYASLSSVHRLNKDIDIVNEFLDLCKDLKIPKAVGMAAIKLVLQIPDEGYRNGVAKSLITRMQLGDFTVQMNDHLGHDLPGRPTWIGDAVAHRFTLRTEDGKSYRCMAPLEPQSPRLAGLMSAVSALSSKALAEALASDVQVWCVADGAGRRSPEDEDDEEWWRFCELFFCLLEQALSDGVPSMSPPYKRLRKTQCDQDMDSDWDWLLGSDVHALQRHRFPGLSDSQDFKPHPELRSPRSELEATSSELWQRELRTAPLVREHLEQLFLCFHLLYEEWKLHTLQARLLPSMALFLYALAKRLKLPNFERHYGKDYPMVEDSALAMTRFGGYGAWLWQNAEGEVPPVPLLQKLREGPVPNILATCRRRGHEIYPEIFPLSSLLLTLHRLLQNRPRPGARQGLEPVAIQGAPATLLTPPAPLLPFSAGGRALPGAERARFVRRWLLERAGRPETPAWEAALVLLVQHQVTPSDVELWTLALALPVQECLRAAAEEPRNDWLVEAYMLIGREDLALMAQPVKGEATLTSRRFRDLLDATEDLSATSADPMASPEWPGTPGAGGREGGEERKVGGHKAPAMASLLPPSFAPEWRVQQLEWRLAEVERVLATLKPQNGSKGGQEPPGDLKPTKDGEDSPHSDDSLLRASSEAFGTAIFLPSGDEVRGGVATMGPCYEVQHSIWDSCMIVGLPIISDWDSVLICLLMLMNIAAQVGFVYIVRQYMSETVYGHDQLSQLIFFRTSIAHQVKYADMVTGRSLARQVCGMDEQLPWASTQYSAVEDLQNYAQTGLWLALLAIGCWLATTLREIFNIAAYAGALRGIETGDETVLEENERDEDERQTDQNVQFTRMSRMRRNLLFLCVVFPRGLVAVVLMDTGTRYLANTIALEDLILNAVALAFILDLDELIESAFAPRRARFLLDEINALPIPRVYIPGYGPMNAGIQERAKNTMKLLMLVCGLIAAYVMLLWPLHDRISLAINILCGGEKDFIYAVNPATGIIETTNTFKDSPEHLTRSQRTVLRLADPGLFTVPEWDVTQEQLDRFYENAPPALHRSNPLSDDPDMAVIKWVEAIELSDVKDQAGMMPCMDESYPKTVARPQLLEVANVERCAEVDIAQCAWRNMTALRALCPETCGCDNAIDPAAGAFSSTAFGCPKLCVWKSLTSRKMQSLPCDDWTPQRFINDPYIANFMHGMFAYVLNKQELKKPHIIQYRNEMQMHFWDLLPGPNKTLSLDLAVLHYASLGWVHDLVQGKWSLGLDIHHPRGLTGCAFFSSWEIIHLTGTDICRDRSEAWNQKRGTGDKAAELASVRSVPRPASAAKVKSDARAAVPCASIRVQCNGRAAGFFAPSRRVFAVPSRAVPFAARVTTVARLLSSSRPQTLRVPRRPEQTDLDFEHSKQTRLAQAALRQSALCVGRGAFTLGALRPLPTELLPIPALVLSGRFPPQAGVQSLDPSHHDVKLNVWAEFNNGVAAALQVAASSDVSRGWIAHHRSASTPATTDGQVSSNAHAGFLLGLGLRGGLKVLPVADCYKYLRLQHETTSAAVILGLAASHVSSMDSGLTRTCCVHIPSMLPATFSDVEVSSPVQCSAVLALGLLYAGSGHRMMTELLVAEIGRKPTDRVLHDREGYSLAAGAEPFGDGAEWRVEEPQEMVGRKGGPGRSVASELGGGVGCRVCQGWILRQTQDEDEPMGEFGSVRKRELFSGCSEDA
ncbi:Anaphase-promoting complex subunit 1 (APC1) (Cyclosome subunit 1) (Mitotic checkpoint regulator) (Testis-specific gene 24 protein) [Durusdinium trenchii]|uniref:Anaphase-promoting complex subunit 1 (APC1) (Cyclosome subunit 1) (Mitotic checkpoint regulator) (Testis-specific gene 24 protein) n=1 Tax=Durusdinium trenchii TaxID=1381693 RepID=A0ABP0I5W0_9DINO